jgi:FixJ family two-component response regulator
MAWVITGALNKQIAAELGIVENTVKVHRARVMEKMRVVSVAELVRVCALVGK